jgi:hypothetical protein
MMLHCSSPLTSALACSTAEYSMNSSFELQLVAAAAVAEQAVVAVVVEVVVRDLRVSLKPASSVKDNAVQISSMKDCLHSKLVGSPRASSCPLASDDSGIELRIDPILQC